MAYDNNLTGIISKNDRKESEKHPDLKGQCEIDGVEYWIGGWRKERKSDGGTFYSLKFTPKEEKPSKPAKQERQDDSEEIPF